MTRRLIVLLIALALTLLVAPLAAEAQPVTPMSRIGLLRSGHPPAGPDPNLEAFRQALRDLGYAEGQNLVLESRYAAGSGERLPVAVLVAPGTAAIRAAQQATRTIQIVAPPTGGGAHGHAAGLRNVWEQERANDPDQDHHGAAPGANRANTSLTYVRSEADRVAVCTIIPSALS